MDRWVRRVRSQTCATKKRVEQLSTEGWFEVHSLDGVEGLVVPSGRGDDLAQVRPGSVIDSMSICNPVHTKSVEHTRLSSFDPWLSKLGADTPLHTDTDT
jgi:hypothetical protein